MARRMVAPITSIKHFIPRTDTLTAINTAVTLVIATAVAAPASAATNEVREGSVVKAVHVQLWWLANGSANTSTQCVQIFEKIPAGQSNPTTTNLLNLQSYLNKKNILHTFQGNMNAKVNGGSAMAPISNWVLIPKGKQRMGLGDKLVISFMTVAQTVNTCGMFIYKEYR